MRCGPSTSRVLRPAPSTANLSLEIGQIDGMIDPEQTREVIVESLATLATKRRVKRTTKHHGNQPL